MALAKVDEQDVRILQCIVHDDGFRFDAKPAFEEIARKLGTTAVTVRTQWTRLLDDGVVRGFEVWVNPSAFGRTLARLECRTAPHRRAQLASQLAAIDGARLLIHHHGDGLVLVHYAPDEQAVTSAARLATALGAEADDAFAVPVPPTPRALDATDWRLVRSLREDPRASHATIAKELGKSAKTVRRRIERLVAEKVVMLSLSVDMPRLGWVNAEARGGYEGGPPPAFREWLASRNDRMFTALAPSRFVTSHVLGSTHAATRLREELLDVDDLRDVRVDLIDRREVLDSWLDAAIAARLG